MTKIRTDVIYGIAVADAIGNPLEFYSSVDRLQFDHSASASTLRASDDTQMTLFLYESLVREGLSLRSITEETYRNAYLRWLSTQYAKATPVLGEGLLSFRSLHCTEAPGRTCLASCHSISKGEKVSNDSKGNGTVMRCSPIAVLGLAAGWSLEEQVKMAHDDAKTTHLHPFAAESSMFLVCLYHHLFKGKPLHESLQLSALFMLNRGAQQVADLVLSMGSSDTFRTTMKNNALGGWVAEEALAMAVGSVLHNDTYIAAIADAICISGDSDTVGGIAGGLAVASGMPVPEKYIKKLNVKDAMDYLLLE